MPEFLLSVIRFIRLLLSGHQAIAIENAVLRLQLFAFQRKRKRPVLTTFDRVSGKAMARTGPGFAVPVHLHLIGPIRPTRGHIRISPSRGLYQMPSLCIFTYA